MADVCMCVGEYDEIIMETLERCDVQKVKQTEDKRDYEMQCRDKKRG